MKSKQIVLISALGAVLLTVAWFFLLWSPATAKLEKARADKVAAEQRHSEVEARLARLKRLNADALERDRVALAAAIPDEDKLDEFMHQVNERAINSGVALVSIAPTPAAATAAAAGSTPAPAGAPPSVALQMQVNGDYFAVMRFLESLRDGPRLVTVDNLTMTKGNDNTPLTATIAGKMFIAPPAAVAPSATPTPTASA